MSKTRDISIDILKIISMAAVLFLHTQRNAELGVVFNPVLYYGSRFAMPVFFMINGMLILDHEEYTFQYYKRKIFNMIRITVIWGIITAIYSLFFEGASIIQAAINGIRCLYGGHIVPFWFITTFAIIYTLLLFSFKVVKKHLNLIVLILGIICFLIDSISLVNIFFFNGFYIQEPVNQRIRLWTWLFYFLMGYKLKDIKLPHNLKYVMPIFVLIMTILAIIYQYFIFVIKLNKINSSYCYESPLIMFWVCCVFVCVRNIKWPEKNRFNIVAQQISKCSFGVFLFHMFFIKCFDTTSRFTTPFSSFLVWFILWNGCLLISFLISKIPYLKKTIEY